MPRQPELDGKLAPEWGTLGENHSGTLMCGCAVDVWWRLCQRLTSYCIGEKRLRPQS